MPKLAIHVPNTSTRIPEDVWPEFVDLHTYLIAREAWPGAEIICANVSRQLVAFELYDSNALEEMAEVGRCVLYIHDHRRESMRKDPPRLGGGSCDLGNIWRIRLACAPPLAYQPSYSVA